MTVSHEQIIERLERGDKRFDEIESTQVQHGVILEELRDLLKVLVGVRKTGRFVGFIGRWLRKAIIWLGLPAAGLTAIIVMFREFTGGLFK